jgi:hypothetical protein
MMPRSGRLVSPTSAARIEAGPRALRTGWASRGAAAANPPRQDRRHRPDPEQEGEGSGRPKRWDCLDRGAADRIDAHRQELEQEGPLPGGAEELRREDVDVLRVAWLRRQRECGTGCGRQEDRNRRVHRRSLVFDAIASLRQSIDFPEFPNAWN